MVVVGDTHSSNTNRLASICREHCDRVALVDNASELDPEFFRWLWNFNRQYRKKYHQILSQLEGKEVYIFRNRRQLKKFLESI